MKRLVVDLERTDIQALEMHCKNNKRKLKPFIQELLERVIEMGIVTDLYRRTVKIAHTQVEDWPTDGTPRINQTVRIGNLWTSDKVEVLFIDGDIVTTYYCRDMETDREYWPVEGDVMAWRYA